MHVPLIDETIFQGSQQSNIFECINNGSLADYLASYFSSSKKTIFKNIELDPSETLIDLLKLINANHMANNFEYQIIRGNIPLTLVDPIQLRINDRKYIFITTPVSIVQIRTNTNLSFQILNIPFNKTHGLLNNHSI